MTSDPVRTMPCKPSILAVSRNMLVGYCAIIWAEPITMDGNFIGTAVLDQLLHYMLA